MTDTSNAPPLPTSLGFPTGYFVIRSLSTGRVWDVSGDLKDDGTLVHLFREKEASLVEGLRDRSADNQVFFVDYSGTLCSKPSGNAIDVQDGSLVLRHRRPMLAPFPNAYSHPLPRFAYSPSTGHIEVRFAADPAYPPPNNSPSMRWRERHHLVTSIPMRKPPTFQFLTDATDFFANTASLIASPFDAITRGAGAVPVASPIVGEFALREDEVVEEERGEEGEVDDSPESHRDMRVISLPMTWSAPDVGPLGGTAHSRERRRWEIVPILREKTKNRQSIGK